MEIFLQLRLWSIFILMCFTLLSLTSCKDVGSVSVSSSEDLSKQGLRITGDTTIADGAVGKITLSLNYYTATDVTVRVKTFDGTASSVTNADFHAFDDTVVIPAGQKEKSVSLVTFNHYNDSDTDKTLTVQIMSATRTEILKDTLDVTIKGNVGGPYIDKVSKLALGSNHTCAILQDGRIMCWGDSHWGQLGISSAGSSPTEIVTDSGATSISSYKNNVCVAYADGSANCWGDNTSYSLTNSTSTIIAPQKVYPAGSSITYHSAGLEFTCLIANGGNIYCRGSHAYGQTGCTGVIGGSYSTCPVTPPVAVTATQIDSGSYHSCAVMSDESVICWGSNWHGVLGYGVIGTSYGTPSTTIAAGSGVTQVTAGEMHTCALTNSGAVYCWGNNDYNQLGQAAASATDTMVATAVVGLPEAITKISAGFYHTCALGASGAVYCWGYNGTGANATGSVSDSSAPAEITNAPSIATDVEAGGYHTCLISDDEPYCWGLANNLQISSRESTFLGRPSDPFMFAKTSIQKIMSSPDDALRISHTCAQLSNNNIVCTGDNTYGQLGINSLTPSSYWSLNYPTVSNLIADFVTGLNHTCALLINGGVECWGRNHLNQIASGSVTAKEDPPVAPSGLPTTVTQLSAGRNHNCALTSAGDVYCWGDPTYGQSGSCSSSTTANLISGLSNVSSIVAGGNTSCVVQTDGKVKCWGDNSYAQLGRGDTWTSCDTTPVNALLPDSGPQETVQQLSLGFRHGCAITTSNQLKCWGSDGYGQIGAGLEEIGTKLHPFRITSMDNAKQVNASSYHTCAIDSESGVKCWGYNVGGLTGVNNTSDENKFSLDPTDVYGLNFGVEKLFGGETFTCALTDRGYPKCWGSFLNNQPVLKPRRVYAP